MKLCFRPFTLVEGVGFIDFAKKLVAIGAKYGADVNVEELLPSRTTVSRHLADVVARKKDVLVSKLAQVSKFGITTDLWTHHITNVGYISVTAHYIDENWDTICLILAMRSVEERHTAKVIQQTVRCILQEFSADRSDNIYVTDNASSMKAAFQDVIWQGCSCHNLNLVLQHGFETKSRVNDEDDEGLPNAVTELINTCKELVRLAKKTRLNSSLDTTLKQCVPTRWNSTLITLKSVHNNLAQLRAFGTDPSTNKNVLRLLADISEPLLEEMIAVLQPFDTATKELSTDTKPAMHLVVPTKFQLRKHLSTSVTDSMMTAQLKQHLLLQLEQYFKVTVIHCSATILDPRLKVNTSIMDSDQRAKAICSLKEMVSNATTLCQQAAACECDALENTEAPSTKRLRMESSQSTFFADLFTSTSSSLVINEVTILSKISSRPT